MTTKTKKIIFISAMSLALLLVAVPALAQTDLDRCKQLNDQFGGLFSWAVNSSYCTINGLIIRVINIMLGLSGTFAFLFLVWGGFRYITAGGNEESTEKARKTLTNSVIGLTVILLAAMIVRITANFITGNSGTGTTGTSTTDGTTSGTTPGGTTGAGGTTGSTDQSAVNTAVRLLANSAVIYPPDNNTVIKGKTLSVGVSLPKSDAIVSALTLVCNVSDPTAAGISMYFNGKLITTGKFSVLSQQYLANAKVPTYTPDPGVTSGTIDISICGPSQVPLPPFTLTIQDPSQ